MRPLHKNPHRETLDADVAAYLAKGGEIRDGGKNRIVELFMGTRAQLNALYKTGPWLAASMMMTQADFDAKSYEPDFPLAYDYEGTLYWQHAQVRKWFAKRGFK